MTQHEWQSLEVGDRVWWCASSTAASGVVLAISARSVLIAWDDAPREEFKVQHRWMLEPGLRKTQRAS